MRTKTILATVSACALFGLPAPARAAAQLEVPKVVSGRAVLSKTAVHPGEPVKIALVLKIQKGWHINSNDPGDEFMFPSSLVFEDLSGFEVKSVAFPEPKRATFEYSDFELRIYEDTAVIGVLVQVAPDVKPGSYKLTGAFKYQACDSSSCIMPQDLPVEVPVEVVAAGVETKDVEPELFGQIPFKDNG